MLLVFASRQSIITTMDKSWYRNIFSRASKPALETTPPALDYADAESQFNLGVKFASGAGVNRDYVQAAEWYRKAAAQSHSLAQFNLGIMYAQGQGVAPDAVQSLMWLGKAARQGDAGAQFNLADRCHRASFEQVPVDASESRIEAYMWYRLAAAQGFKNSDSVCATLSLNMTRADVAAGNERVAAFESGKAHSAAGR
jgi:hypothetical protein